MSTLTSFIFLTALAAMIVVYPLYFIELSTFGKVMAREHPDLVDGRRPDLAGAYRLLRRVKAGKLGHAPLSPDAALAHARVTRCLYIGMSLFMVVLFIGLTDAVISKHVGRA